MRARATTAIVLVLMGNGACAFAQGGAVDLGPESYQQGVVDQEDAFGTARSEFRGLKPFAVASYAPVFGGEPWFILSFFHYWTGYQTTGTAEEHWIVRQVTGTRGNINIEPVTPQTSWAWSDTCPALEPELRRFRLPLSPAFTDGAVPAYDPNKLQVSARDYSWVRLWARISADDVDGEITLSVLPNDRDLGSWVFDTRSSLGDCFVEQEPAAPGLGDFRQDDYLFDEPLDVFK